MKEVEICKILHKTVGMLACIVLLQGCSTVYWAEKKDKRDPVCNAGLGSKTLEKQSSYDRNAGVSLGNQRTLDGKYTLLDLVNFALENSPDARQAWFAAKQRVAYYGMAKSRLYPTVDLSAMGRRTQIGESPYETDDGTDTIITYRQDSFQPAVAINYKLFQFGADLAAIEAAKDRLYAANLQFNRSLQTVIYNVQKAYYDFYAASETVRARDANRKDARSAFDVVAKKTEAGLASIQNFLQAKSNWLQADYDYKSSIANVENCRATLAENVGVSVSKTFKIVLEKVQSTPHLEKDVEALIKKAHIERQDLHAQKTLLTATTEEEAAQRRAFWPKLMVGLTSSVQKYGSPPQSSWQKNYQGSMGFQWNFFDGLSSTYSIILARQQKAAQREALRYAEIRAAGDVWRAFYGLKTAIRQLRSAQSLMEASSKSFEAIKIGYDSGINSVLDLLSSQTSLAQARLFQIQSESNLALSLARLAYSIGDQSSNRISEEVHYGKL